MSLTAEQISLYTNSWIGKPKPQIAEEIASLSMETKRIPDPYPFDYDANGKLISPETGRLIESSIDKVSSLGKLEYEGFLFIQQLGWENRKGTIFWISPPHPLRSKETKLVVTNILDNPPRLFNRAFILNIDTKGALELANKIGQSHVYINSDQLRQYPIYTPEDFDFSLIPDKRQVEMVRNGQDLRSKKEALVWGEMAANDLSRLNNIQEEKTIFGAYDTSCPTAFEIFTASDEYGPLTFKCQNGHWNTRAPHTLKKYCETCNCDMSCSEPLSV